LDTLSELLTRHGLTIVFVSVALRQLGVPLPAWPLLVVAGALMADGTLHPASLAAVVIVGSLLGDTPWYFAGRHYGHRVLRTVCRVALEPDTCVKHTENTFARWGAASLMIAKYVPGFSTVAPPLAGAMRLALWRFLVFSAIAAILWGAPPIAGGAYFRAEVEWLIASMDELGGGAALLIAAVAALYVGAKGLERFLLIRLLRSVRVTPEELHQALQGEQRPVVLDARAPIARELSPARIPGAIVVDLATAEGAVAGVAHDRDVVVYCS
jgi:membrane protein DedA with SNARE-associated domain